MTNDKTETSNRSGRWKRSRDPFSRQRPVTGKRARFRWWQRLGAAVGLVMFVSVLGSLLSVVVGLLFFVLGLAIENVIS